MVLSPWLALVSGLPPPQSLPRWFPPCPKIPQRSGGVFPPVFRSFLQVAFLVERFSLVFQPTGWPLRESAPGTFSFFNFPPVFFFLFRQKKENCSGKANKKRSSGAADIPAEVLFCVIEVSDMSSGECAIRVKCPWDVLYTVYGDVMDMAQHLFVPRQASFVLRVLPAK